MDHRAYFALLADYNAWANRRLVAGLAPLDDAAWHADQGLFFKSIHATFNHNLLVEMLWIGRLAGQPWSGGGLDTVLDPTRAGLVAKLAASQRGDPCERAPGSSVRQSPIHGLELLRHGTPVHTRQASGSPAKSWD